MAFSIAVCSGRDLFAITGITMFRYLGVLFHIVYYCWGIKNGSSCRGRRYKEVCYIEVPLYFISWPHVTTIFPSIRNKFAEIHVHYFGNFMTSREGSCITHC